MSEGEHVPTAQEIKDSFARAHFCPSPGKPSSHLSHLFNPAGHIWRSEPNDIYTKADRFLLYCPKHTPKEFEGTACWPAPDED